MSIIVVQKGIGHLNHDFYSMSCGVSAILALIFSLPHLRLRQIFVIDFMPTGSSPLTSPTRLVNALSSCICWFVFKFYRIWARSDMLWLECFFTSAIFTPDRLSFQLRLCKCTTLKSQFRPMIVTCFLLTTTHKKPEGECLQAFCRLALIGVISHLNH